jgi:hypothetical protein
MTPTHTTGPLAAHPLRAPVLWGAAWGLIQAAVLFVVIAAAAVTGPAWLLVLGFTGHGLKTSGSTAATMSPTPAGGHRSASSSTGSPRPSSCS